MGTNYYVKSDICEKCGRGDEDLHIGKSSTGWCFGLKVYPDMNIHNLDDWKKYLKDKKVFDEYDDFILLDDLMSVITDRKWIGTNNYRDKKPLGYNSWVEFHMLNYSQPGPNGLLRHKIDGRHCVGHGNGTYDYMTGGFS